VGSTVNIERRWKEHKQRFKTGAHPARHLASAFNAYGEKAFEFVILEECDISNEALRIERETYWMRLLKPVFNVAPIAGSVLGLKRSEEVRAKMSKAQKGRPSKLKGVARSPDARAAISSGRKGMKFAPEHIANMSAALKGRASPRKGVTLSDETKARISASKSGKKQDPAAVKARAEANRGRVRTAEQRERMSAAKRGKAFSLEHRAKLSKAAKLRRAREKLTVPPA